MSSSTSTWRGIYHATQADHDSAYARFGDTSLVGYRYEVEEAGSVEDGPTEIISVRVSAHPDAANGIWTIAEYEAGCRELGWDPQTDRLVRMMREVTPGCVGEGGAM